ncbi:MAG: 4Fe-4S binding protein [bacterium]|jgi:polyferredoxin
MAPITITRRLFQGFILAACVYLMVKLLAGVSTRTVEYYCPMGGIVSVWGLIRRQQFICALNEMNVTIGVALLLSVLLVKKAFCSWVCPLGTLFEGLTWLRRKTLGKKRLRLPDYVDSRLIYLRYVVLAVILVFTYRLSELVFRGYDPFYILFTGARGHETIPIVSALIIVGVVAAAFLFEMSWCRYLCPLNAVMSPISKAGVFKVKRDSGKCTACGACDDVCLQRIPVSQLRKVSRVDCTNCLDCVSKCRVPGAMDISV